MRVFLLVLVSSLSLLACSSTTIGPGASWGTVAGINFVPVDGFYLLSTDSTTGDYNFTVIAVDTPGYCTALLANTAAFLANMNYATLIYSNPVGTGQLDPPPGIYPVTAAPGPNATAQASFASVANCVPNNPVVGTAGTVGLQGVAVDYSQLLGSLNVTFGTSGGLIGNFTAPLCDISNSPQGPSTCVQ
jgi:hypothetical protein